MLRRVTTSMGVLEYELTFKQVKNLNLRIGAGGEVKVSAPRGAGAGQADAFVAKKAGGAAAPFPS